MRLPDSPLSLWMDTFGTYNPNRLCAGIAQWMWPSLAAASPVWPRPVNRSGPSLACALRSWNQSISVTARAGAMCPLP